MASLIRTINCGPDYSPAAHPVACTQSPSGKHHPRTVESITPHRDHVKTSVCRHCNKVA